MKVKYPMHYVPEVLMLALTAAGAYVKFAYARWSRRARREPKPHRRRDRRSSDPERD